VGSVVDGGGGDLFKWIEINKRNKSNTTTKREVNTAAAAAAAAAVQSRGLCSLRIDLKVCQTGPK
jgi:hypothetical protein